MLLYLETLLEANGDAKAEYERLGLRYEVIQSIVRARKAAGLTQLELTARMQVSRPVVTRLESWDHEPRLHMIQRAADALSCQIVVEFNPQPPTPPARSGGAGARGVRPQRPPSPAT